jgi:MerR family transcriptional regulator, light-induced transcriptional regulator
MQNVHFTPPQIARMIGVNVSTVKRWVDKGILPAHKSPGGHRRIREDDIMRFIKEIQPQSSSYILSGWKKDEAIESWKPYYDLHFDYQAQKAQQFIVAKYMAKGNMQQVIEKIVVPTLFEIGERWVAGKIDVTDEHRMSFMIRKDLFVLESLIPATSSKDPHIVLACAPKENHELPLIFLSLIAKDHGWNSTVLGINVPEKGVIKTAKQRGASLIGIAKQYRNNKSGQTYIKNIIKSIPKTCSVLLGGAGWSNEEKDMFSRIKRVSFVKSLEEFSEALHQHKNNSNAS